MQIVRPLTIDDAKEAAELDGKWFEESVTEDGMRSLIADASDKTIAILDDNGVLQGFATFEILENTLPKEYVGEVPQVGKVMFLGNFTTATNYNLQDWSADEVLLKAVEQKAKELGCTEVWEGLAVDHPYKKENKPEFDAYGFYENNGYRKDVVQGFAWQPNEELSIPCVLFRKKIS